MKQRFELTANKIRTHSAILVKVSEFTDSVKRDFCATANNSILKRVRVAIQAIQGMQT